MNPNEIRKPESGLNKYYMDVGGQDVDRDFAEGWNKALLVADEFLKDVGYACQACGQTHAEKLTDPFPHTTNCEECGWPIVACECVPNCCECGGEHEPTGARSDCIRHWKLRALKAENELLVNKTYTP